MLNTWKCCVCFVASKEIKKDSKIVVIYNLIFSAVNTDSETAVVNVTYETREQARQWVNFVLKFFFHECHQMQLQKYWLLSDRLPLSAIVWTNWFSPQTPCGRAGFVWILNVLKCHVINNNKKSTNDCMCILCCNEIKYFKIKKCTFQL